MCKKTFATSKIDPLHQLSYDVLGLPVGVDAAVGEYVGGEVCKLDEAVDRRPHRVRLARARHTVEREGP